MFSKADKDNKRKQIINCAAKLFAEAGYYKTTIEDIAHQAGIGKSTVYEYFSSKEELFKSIIISGCEAYMEFLKKQQANLVDADSKIKGIFYCWLFFISRHTELQRVLSSCMYDRSLQDTIQYLASNFTELMVIPVKRILSEGMEKEQIRNVDLAFATDLIVSMMFSLTHLLALRQEKGNLKQAVALSDACGVCALKGGHEDMELKEVPEIRLLADQAADLILKGLAPR